MSEPDHHHHRNLTAIAIRISRLCSGFITRCYVKSKLATDPLYDGVFRQLEGSPLPLLDIGCGMGLLAMYLRERGWVHPAHGVDFDARKISEGQVMLQAGKYSGISLAKSDAREGLPDHSGNVTILDILQFMDPGQQEHLLKTAAQAVAPGGKLVIRSGLREANWRFRVTHWVDMFAKLTFWMKSAPNHYPTRETFEKPLGEAGLKVAISPLWGNTPFNNYLIVAER